MISVTTMTTGGSYGKSYTVDAPDGWAALEVATPLAEADGYEVLDGTDHGDEFVLVVAG